MYNVLFDSEQLKYVKSFTKTWVSESEIFLSPNWQKTEFFGINFWNFQNFQKNSPGEWRKEGVYKVSFGSEHWKYVKSCTKTWVSESEFFLSPNWQKIEFFGINFLNFQNFPKNSPGEWRKEGAYKVLFASDHWKYVESCINILVSVSEFFLSPNWQKNVCFWDNFSEIPEFSKK